VEKSAGGAVFPPETDSAAATSSAVNHFAHSAQQATAREEIVCPARVKLKSGKPLWHKAGMGFYLPGEGSQPPHGIAVAKLLAEAGAEVTALRGSCLQTHD
jgi:hypothetical protein